MKATLLLAGSLRRQASLGPMTVSVRGKSGRDSVRLTPLQADEIATLLTRAVEALQRQFAAAMAAARDAMVAGDAPDTAQISDWLEAYPDLLNWLADSEIFAKVVGPWVTERDPWCRWLICRALANCDVDALDEIDRRWRQGDDNGQ